MLNKVFLHGRFGADPELRRTASGAPVTTATIAVDRDFSQNGQRETDWIELVAFNKTAEFLANHFSKGKTIIVVGRLQIRKWEDKNGNKRTSCEVVVENAYFGESKSQGERYESAMQKPVQDYAVMDGDDDALPF